MASTTAPRQSRWGPRSTFTAPVLAGLNLAIEAPMTAEQVEAYALHVRISEITQKLEMDDLVPANPIRRSPSPAPEYDTSGRRINTCYQRYRESLIAERQSLISQAAQNIPNYRPPAGFRYTTPPRTTEKLYIPVKDFPEVNFIGQILGPRGRSLTETATASGATIALRGKGSAKEGRGRANNSKLRDDMNEPLHCLITADSQAKVENAKSLLNETIEWRLPPPSTLTLGSRNSFALSPGSMALFEMTKAYTQVYPELSTESPLVFWWSVESAVVMAISHVTVWKDASMEEGEAPWNSI